MDTPARDIPSPGPGAASAEPAAASRSSSHASVDRLDSVQGHELFELRSELTLVRLKDACARLEPSATLHLLDGRLIAARLERRDGELQALAETPVIEGIHQLRTILFGVVFIVYAELTRADPLVPERATLQRTRWFTFDRRHVSRLPVEAADVDMLWFDPGRGAVDPVRARVVDLTPDGLSVLAPDLPDEGLFPAAIRLGDQVIECAVESRRRAEGPGGLQRFGLSLQTDPRDERLKEAYVARRFPRLRRRSELELSALDELFRRSGYLDLREGEGVSPAFRAFSQKSSLSCDVVYTAQDGAAIGHVSITRAYPQTWLMHQLATLSKHPESVACRTAIYDFGASIPVLMDGDQARALAYFDLNKRWHQLFFHEFVRWIDSPRDAAIAVFDRFERVHDAPVAPQPGAELDLRPAAQADFVAVTSLVRRQLPSVLSAALDVYPWTLCSDNLLRSSDAREFPRTRGVLVLREGGVVRGVALCETGPSAASLFNILNMAQIYVQQGVHAPSRAGQVALLHAARQFYAERGVENPLVIAPKDSIAAFAEAGTRLAETMGVIALTARALRQWENFCRFHFGVQTVTPKVG